MFCRNCGGQLPADSNFCMKCGKSVGVLNEGYPATARVVDNVGAVVDEAFDFTKRAFASRAEVEGVGGWLLFFCVSTTILAPTFFLLTFLNGCFSAFDGATNYNMSQHSGDSLSLLISCFFTAPVILLGFICGRLLWKKQTSGLRWLSVYLVVNLALSLVFWVVAGKAQADSAMFQAFVGLVSTIAWWLYFRRSIRVLNTYGRNLGIRESEV